MGGSVKNVTSDVSSTFKQQFKNPLSKEGVIGAGKIGLGAWGLQAFNGGGGGGPGAAGPGQPTPQAILEQTGGAVLLSNIAAGADPTTAMESWLGVAPGGLGKYFAGLDETDRNALQGIQTQVTQIASNTTLRNQAVQKLTDDYPNIIASSIKQFGDMENPAIQQAVQSINAKYGAGIGLSSGAAAAATARATAGMSVDFAQHNYEQQLSEAEALRGFQQKMLGQGAQYGQTAVQAALGRANEVALESQKEQYQAAQEANQRNQQQKSGLFGAIGQIGGTVVGSYFGGPVGGAVGGTAGKAAGGYLADSKQFGGSGDSGSLPQLA